MLAIEADAFPAYSDGRDEPTGPLLSLAFWMWKKIVQVAWPVFNSMGGKETKQGKWDRL